MDSSLDHQVDLKFPHDQDQIVAGYSSVHFPYYLVPNTIVSLQNLITSTPPVGLQRPGSSLFVS